MIACLKPYAEYKAGIAWRRAPASVIDRLENDFKEFL
jgi:hypothetical protein